MAAPREGNSNHRSAIAGLRRSSYPSSSPGSILIIEKEIIQSVDDLPSADPDNVSKDAKDESSQERRESHNKTFHHFDSTRSINASGQAHHRAHAPRCDDVLHLTHSLDQREWLRPKETLTCAGDRDGLD